ncbi:c-type cytochrome [bacterium SCSIO 12741]|nr:c-type cytochrome [bacterium SCSIO 12741]
MMSLLVSLNQSCKKKEEPVEECCETSDNRVFNPTYFNLQKPPYFPDFPQTYKLSEEGVALGRKLFYEKRLSGDGTQSCASCHSQEFAFTDNGRQFSKGIDGKEGDMNAMSLFNLGYSIGFFWNGRSATLQDQAIEPVINPIEMHNTWEKAINTIKGDKEYIDMFYAAFGTDNWDSTHAAEAISQFELTLLSYGSEYDEAVAKINGDPNIDPPLPPSPYRGLRIFNSEPTPTGGGGDCFHCHNSDNMLFTNNSYMNNGLDSDPEDGLMEVSGRASDKGKFKVPTLRNVEFTGPYMHDGRFETLEEVIDFYNTDVKDSPTLDKIMKDHGIAGGLNLTNQEKADLVAFLKTLSDPSFKTNPAFSDPN